MIHQLKNKSVYIGGLALVSASFIGNILNFLYNSYLGRVLGFEHFALIGLMSGLLSFASIFFGAFSTTANYRSAYLIGKYGEEAGYQFWKFIRRRVIYISIVATAVWLLATPFLMRFFDAETPVLFIMFGIVLLTGLANGADRGLISAKFNFGGLAAINLFDPIIRLSVAVILVFLDLKLWAYSAIPAAIFGTFILGWFLVTQKKPKQNSSAPIQEIHNFPYKFFAASLLTGFSSIAFSTFDILLANHYLSSVDAGKYTLISLVGKMIYFLGGLTTPFIIPLISRIEGANKDSKNTMYILAFSTGALAFFGFVVFGLLGSFTIPFLYGTKALTIISFLPVYAFGMMCYTISKVFMNYYLVRKVYTFTIAASLFVFFQVAMIMLFHNNAGSISFAMSIIWTLHLVLIMSLHFMSAKVIKMEKNITLVFRSIKAKQIFEAI